MNWEELKRGFANENLQLSRSAEMKEAYKKYKQEKGGDCVSEVRDFMKKERLDTLLTINKFPYNLAANVLHLVIWIDAEKANIYDAERLLEIYGDHLADFGKEIIIRQNPKHLQSVPQLPHYQVFILV